MNIGDRIKEQRRKLNYTLEDLSSFVGLSRQTLSRYETGVITNIPLDKIEEIAKALETTPEYLLGWSREPDEWDRKVLETYPTFVPGKTYLPMREETSQLNDDIHFIARKMETLQKDDRDMLMRMIRAAFDDDED